MTPWHSPRATLSHATRWIIPACLLLPPSAFLPALDLRGVLPRVAVALSDSASWIGMPVLVTVALVLLLSRGGLSLRQGARELAAMVGALLLFLALGAALNEHVVKPSFGVARPDIVELSSRGLLTMTPEGFYALPDKAARSARLRALLGPSALERLPMDPVVREHWIAETGFSFPSGHSTASVLVAAFFLCIAITVLRGRRRYFFYALIPWAVSVCWARTVLRVHRPVDITVGALQGALLGFAAFGLVCVLAAPSPAREPSSATG